MGTTYGGVATHACSRWLRMGWQALLCSAGLLITVPAMAMADSLHFDIVAQPMPAALKAFAAQAHMQLLYRYNVVQRIRANAISGDLDKHAALEQMLRSSGLEAVYSSDSVATIRPIKASMETTGADDPPQGARDDSSAVRFPLAQASAASSAASGLAGPSPNSQENSKETVALDEIIVTAQKREERLQDVPLSITALSDQTMERMGIQSLADIGRSVPGLNVVTIGPGQNEIIIRGISSAGGIPTTGFYLDDTPLESVGNVAGNAMDPALFDLERVEVLRGPQGTLYGDSSMGGTVRYITAQPQLDVTEGSVKTELSDTDGGGFNYQTNATVNAPLLPGLAAVRVSVFDRYTDGYIDRYPIDPNNYLAAGPGPVDRNVNTESTYGGRVTVLLRPVDNFSITPSVLFQRTDLGGAFTVDQPPGSFDNLIQTRDVSEPTTDEMLLYSLTAKADFGATHITSATSYRNRTFDTVEDDSKTSYYFFSPDPQTYVYPTPFDNNFANHDFTEELRATSSAGPVHGVLGLFYLRQSNFLTFDYPIPAGYNAAFGSPFGDQPFFVSARHELITQRAIYGELTFDLLSNLQGTLGGRAFHISQDEDDYYAGVFQGTPITYGESTNESGFTPKYELSYKVSPDVLTYVTAAKGFRQGGTQAPAGNICNADLAAIGLNYQPTSYDPDHIWNYELGAKTAWLDRRLTVNADVYYIDWRNVQQLIVLPTCGANITANFGHAQSKGGELEIQAKPVQALLLILGVSYNEAKLLSTIAGAQGQPGNTLEDAPRWIGSAAAEYDVKLSARLSGYARMDANATSVQYNSFDPTSIWYRRAGYSLANLRFGGRSGNWDASLFAENLFDKHAETAVPVSYAVDLPTTRRLAINQPRAIGLELRWQF
jgi:iron complex outermembrane receptor protein